MMLSAQEVVRLLSWPSNDQNLWMVLGPGDVKERTFPRKI